jgi:hypothetical protein
MKIFVERSSCTKSGYAICAAVLIRSRELRFCIAASSSAREEAGSMNTCVCVDIYVENSFMSTSCFLRKYTRFFFVYDVHAHMARTGGGTHPGAPDGGRRTAHSALAGPLCCAMPAPPQTCICIFRVNEIVQSDAVLHEDACIQHTGACSRPAYVWSETPKVFTVRPCYLRCIAHMLLYTWEPGNRRAVVQSTAKQLVPAKTQVH